MNRELHGNLDRLLVFAAVAETGSFTAAAERLGITKAHASLQIGRLEAQLGTALFTRTTRRVRLTDAGQALFERTAPALDTLGDAFHSAGSSEGGLSGTLRITAPVGHATQSVAPALAEFAALHPALQFELYTGDRVLNLVEEGIDLAIRLGELRDSSLRAIRLGGFDQIAVAAPDYLARKGTPQTPDDLADHDWIGFTLLRAPLTWTFTRPGSEPRTVRMKARIRVDSSAALLALLQRGAGISVLDQFSTADALRDGRLVRVLPDWLLPAGGVYAVLPPGPHVPAYVRAFVEFYRGFVGRGED